jgi:hypothetical protein
MSELSINDFEEDDKFYLIFETSTFSIRTQIVIPFVEYSRGSMYYSTDEISLFIEKLSQNEDTNFSIVGLFNMNFIIDNDKIHIITENVNIKMSNTENSRKQLINVMNKYIEYLTFLDA